MRRILAPPAPPGLPTGPPPTISVAITAYQNAATVAETVESALQQTTPAHEVLVIDDGSTDGTGSVLEPYLDRIVYLRQENRGRPAAVNTGLRHATGDFITYLDADDVFEPERIEALTELGVMRPDLDLLMTDAYMEVDGKIAGTFFETTPFAVADQELAIYERCFVTWPAMRREKLAAIGGFDESMRISSDWESTIRLLHAGCRVGLVDEPLMRYRIAGDRSLTDNRVASLQYRVRVLELASRLDLSPAERAELELWLPRRKRRALLAEAEQALREGSPRARSLALRIARTPGMSGAERLKGLAAAAAPRAAARRLAKLERKAGGSRIKRGVPRIR
jgi:GT2 family glycosyltransferase